MVARRVQYPATIEKEQPAEVVRNHEGGTWSACGNADPKAHDGNIVNREWTPRSRDGGAFFDNPKRGSPV
jgi:hypothetical protein